MAYSILETSHKMRSASPTSIENQIASMFPLRDHGTVFNVSYEPKPPQKKHLNLRGKLTSSHLWIVPTFLMLIGGIPLPNSTRWTLNDWKTSLRVYNIDLGSWCMMWIRLVLRVFIHLEFWNITHDFATAAFPSQTVWADMQVPLVPSKLICG
jgi:hypothetical protein